MDYITVAEAARRWGVTARLVQGYCARGRVDGAEKFSGSWRIPADAPKPRDLRCGGSAADRGQGAASASMGGLMPLMNTPFAPGGARAVVEGLADGARRDIARAELAYFTGLADEALAAAEPHLGSEDLGVRLSANLICAYANLPLGRIDRTRGALEAVRGAVAEASERDPRLRAAEGFVAQAASVLLHLPAPDPVPEAREVMPLLPPGLRAFAFYVQAHAAYLSGDHARSLGVAETALLGWGTSIPSRPSTCTSSPSCRTWPSGDPTWRAPTCSLPGSSPAPTA